MDQLRDNNTRIEKIDDDIEALDKNDLLVKRDEQVRSKPFDTSGRPDQISNLNSFSLGGGKKVEGSIPGLTFGESLVNQALKHNPNDLWRGLRKVLSQYTEEDGMPVIIDPNSGMFLDKNEVDLAELPLAAEQRFGIEIAMASGYFIDMLPRVNGSGRTLNWNETPERPDPGGSWRRSTSGSGQARTRADGTEFTPTSIARAMTPQEFSFFTDIARSTLMERSDAAAWLNENLVYGFKERSSPEAFSLAGSLTGIIGVTSANLQNNSNEGKVVTGNAAIDIAGANKTAANEIGKTYMDACLQLRDDLSAQRPGKKVMAIARNALTVMQESRATGDSLPYYPSLSDPVPNHAGLDFVPIDVGIPAPVETASANNPIGVMMDWGMDSAHIVADMSIFLDPYTQRLKGLHRYIHDGKTGYAWWNRFGIGILRRVNSAS